MLLTPATRVDMARGPFWEVLRGQNDRAVRVPANVASPLIELRVPLLEKLLRKLGVGFDGGLKRLLGGGGQLRAAMQPAGGIIHQVLDAGSAGELNVAL